MNYPKNLSLYPTKAAALMKMHRSIISLALIMVFPFLAHAINPPEVNHAISTIDQGSYPNGISVPVGAALPVGTGTWHCSWLNSNWATSDVPFIVTSTAGLQTNVITWSGCCTASPAVFASSQATSIVAVIKMSFALDEDKIAWTGSGTYDAKANLTADSYNTENVEWTLALVEGTPATIDGASGLVKLGTGGGKYSIKAKSKDLGTCEAVMTLIVVKVSFALDEHTVVWVKDSTFDAKGKILGGSYNIAKLVWSIATVVGASATIDGSSGLVTFGDGGGKYTIKAKSMDVGGCDDVMTLNILDVESIDVWDSDLRHASGGVLEIANEVSEGISGKVKIIPSVAPPLYYPSWMLNGGDMKYGETTSYAVYNSAIAIVFLPLVPPDVYTISCNGRNVQVNAYCSREVEVTLNFGKLQTILSNTKTVLNIALPNFEPEILKGTATFKNSWKECPTSNKAYWTFDLAANFDPLVGIKGRYPIGPTPPKWLQKWIFAQMYVDFAAGLKLAGNVSRNNCGIMTGTVPVSGELSGTFGCEAFAAGVLSFTASGKTAVKASGAVAVKDTGVILEKLGVEWTGIKMKVKIHTKWAFLDVNQSSPVANPQPIVAPVDVPLYTFTP